MAIDFFQDCLTFTAGEWMGRPFVLQPWQQTIVGNLFGWKRPNGRRPYREAFTYVPRKCGKSDLAGRLGCLRGRSRRGQAALQCYLPSASFLG